MKTIIAFCHKCKTLMFLCPGCGEWHHVKNIKPSLGGNAELIAEDGHTLYIPYSEIKKAEEHFKIKTMTKRPRCKLDMRKLCLHSEKVVDCYEGKPVDCERLKERENNG